MGFGALVLGTQDSLQARVQKSQEAKAKETQCNRIDAVEVAVGRGLAARRAQGSDIAAP